MFQPGLESIQVSISNRFEADYARRNEGMIASLRSRFGRLTAGGRVLTGRTLPFGDQAIDGVLPWGGLPAGSLHEMVGEPAGMTGFLAAYLGRIRRSRPVLWIGAAPMRHARGVAAFGFDHRRLTLTWMPRAADRLAAFEDALCTPGYAAVVAEIDGLEATAIARLQQAAAAGNGLGLLLRGDPSVDTAALTRWSVSPVPGDGRAPRWQVGLERCPGARPVAWQVGWDAAARRLTVGV